MSDQWSLTNGTLLTGTATFSTASKIVVGAGTNFAAGFAPGDLVAYQVGGVGPRYFARVDFVTDSTHLTLLKVAPINSAAAAIAVVKQFTGPVKGTDGHGYTLAPPTSQDMPSVVDGGKLLVPTVAVDAVNALTLPAWIATTAPASPPAPPALPASPALMAPPGGEELDTFVVIGQTDGHTYTVTAYDTGGAVYRQFVPAQAINPLLADNWTLV
jgi:hypothetical protein